MASARSPLDGSGPRAVLIVEDDEHIADLVALYLRRDGFRVVAERTGPAALEALGRERPALVILDLGLPGGVDGTEVCRRIRTGGDSVPVLMLTARDAEVDRIVGLELGADDYVTKPFSPLELVARVKAILRRVDGPARARPAVWAMGPVEIDDGRREVRVDGVPVALTTREFDLLSYMAANRGLALSRQQLLDGVWGPGWYGDERTVDVHVGQLRKKLGDPLPLTTVWGVGYRLG